MSGSARELEKATLDESSDAEVLLVSGEGMENSLTSRENAPLIDEGAHPASLDDPKGCCSFKAVTKWLITNLLLLLTAGSVLVGFIIGVSVREVDIDRDTYSFELLVELLSFPGEVFLRMLKMLILPLIVFSLLAGLGSLETKVAGTLGWKTVLYYMCTTFLAVVLGLIVVNIIRPGGRQEIFECDNSTLHGSGNDLKVVDTILDLIRNMIPENLFAATFRQAETYYTIENVTNFKKCLELYNLTRDDVTYTLSELVSDNKTKQATCSMIQQYFEEMNLSCANATVDNKHFIGVGHREGMNVLGIIVFTVAFGIVLGRQGEEGRRIVHAVGVLNTVIMKLVSLAMWYSPIGIASIVAGKLVEVDDFGVLFKEIGLYFVTVLVGLLIHGCLVLPLIYTVMTRKNPLRIIKAVLQALLTAFATSSSSATLPITIQNLEDNFGADPRVTRFMLPVGATINMDGTALYEAVAAVFIAQVENDGLSFAKMIIISITATCASVGAAGVPQAGLFTLVIVLVAVGLNPDNVALILAVDWLLDRFRTTVNVLGDTFGVGIVEHHSRKQLGPFPKPLLQQNETAEESSDSFPNDHFHRRSPDYGTSTSPPPTLQQIPSSEWSVCSHESGQMAGMSSHSEVSGCTMGVGGHAEGAAEGASENGPVSGNQKRLSGSSFGSLDIQESTNL